MQNTLANKREWSYFQFAERNSKLRHKCEPSNQGGLVVSFSERVQVMVAQVAQKIPLVKHKDRHCVTG
jgi:hypothetical protein